MRSGPRFLVPLPKAEAALAASHEVPRDLKVSPRWSHPAFPRGRATPREANRLVQHANLPAAAREAAAGCERAGPRSPPQPPAGMLPGAIPHPAVPDAQAAGGKSASSAVRRGRPAPLLLPPGTCPALRQRRAALPALGAAPVGAAGSWLVLEGKASFPGSAPAPRCLRGRERCSSLGKQAWRGSRRSCRALGIFDGYQYSQKLGMGVEPLVSESVEDQDEVPPCYLAILHLSPAPAHPAGRRQVPG